MTAKNQPLPEFTITVTDLKLREYKTWQERVRSYGRDISKKARVYASPQGETVLENFFGGRHNRPHRELQRQIRAVVDAELIVAGYNPQKWSWSQKAGCTCPCSPGWIVSGEPGRMDCDDVEVFVTYQIEEVKQDQDAQS